MDFTVGILLGTFLWSIAALFIFNCSMAQGLFGSGTAAATEIFAVNELGAVEDPGVTAPRMNMAEAEARSRADQSTWLVVGVALRLTVIWLVLASLAGLISSIKLHEPDWWVQYEWLTFGHICPIHLNLLAYGWCSLAGIGVAV